MYWESLSGLLESAPLAGGAISAAATDTRGGGDVVAVGDTVYWSVFGSGSNGSIESLSPSGAKLAIASGLPVPRGLAVDPLTGHVYWEQNNNAIASDLGPISTPDAYRAPLSIDAGRVYWTVANAVMVYGPNGVSTYAANQNGPTFVSATPAGIFWTTSDGLMKGPSGVDVATQPQLIVGGQMGSIVATTDAPAGVYFMTSTSLNYVDLDGANPVTYASLPPMNPKTTLLTPNYVTLTGDHLVWASQSGIWAMTPRGPSASDPPFVPGSGGTSGSGGTTSSGGTTASGGTAGSGGTSGVSITAGCEKCISGLCSEQACNADSGCNVCLANKSASGCATNTNFQALLKCLCGSSCARGLCSTECM